jgi:hypothetical protein
MEGRKVGELAMNPTGGVRLDIPKDIRHSAVLAQSGEYVNMIGHAIHQDGDAALVADGTTEIFVEPRFQVGIDQRATFFG